MTKLTTHSRSSRKRTKSSAHWTISRLRPTTAPRFSLRQVQLKRGNASQAWHQTSGGQGGFGWRDPAPRARCGLSRGWRNAHRWQQKEVAREKGAVVMGITQNFPRRVTEYRRMMKDIRDTKCLRIPRVNLQLDRAVGEELGHGFATERGRLSGGCPCKSTTLAVALTKSPRGPLLIRMAQASRSTRKPQSQRCASKSSPCRFGCSDFRQRCIVARLDTFQKILNGTVVFKVGIGIFLMRQMSFDSSESASGRTCEWH